MSAPQAPQNSDTMRDVSAPQAPQNSDTMRDDANTTQTGRAERAERTARAERATSAEKARPAKTARSAKSARPAKTARSAKSARPAKTARSAKSAKTAKTPRRRDRGPAGGGPVQNMVGGDKPKDFKRALRMLLNYLGTYKLALVAVAVFAIASTVFTIIGPKLLGNATTELFNGVMGQIAGSGTGPDFSTIGTILLSVLALYGISALFQLIQGLLMANVANQISYRLRRDIDAKIMRLPFSYYDSVATGDVMSRITNDVDAINQSLSQSITQIITSVASLIGVIVMMCSISWLMTLAAILTLPLSVGIIGFIVRKSQRHFSGQQHYLGMVNGQVEENFGAHSIVQAFNGQEQALADFDRDNGQLYQAAWKANFLSGLMMPMMNFVGNIGYVIVCFIGAWLAIGGSMQVGDIQAFIQYMRNFQQPLVQAAQISNIVQQTLAAAERVFTFLAEEEEVADVAREKAVDPTTVESSVAFEHVRFGYSPQKPIIHDFTANIAPGQKVAIVGPTGAGKTTMVKLLMRFYDVDSGAILVGGADVRAFERDDLRELFGMVLQDTWLYSASITDNIRYGQLDATDEQVREAAKVAQADHFITTLPRGYAMVINEEASNISQGQKQLLTIARAVLANPRILILDEATSSVDTRTELLIQRAMDNLMEGRTSFIIAHRLSTIRNADLILVMDKGDIVEQGTHAGLLKAGGFYARLYNSQFEAGEEE
ncbi:MAG: ATP-binding cassette domain-containing protein [Coriobacteriales bacterium]|jgi:ATP-binding cassette subfamily B protein|nr:ATP-binding cassette domain-containing protein [Coriobacteriales bacterium]